MANITKPVLLRGFWYCRPAAFSLQLDAVIDVRVLNRGALYLLMPLTDTGRNWLLANTSGAWKWLSGSLAVAKSYAGPIVDSMVADGLNVEV